MTEMKRKVLNFYTWAFLGMLAIGGAVSCYGYASTVDAQKTCWNILFPSFMMPFIVCTGVVLIISAIQKFDHSGNFGVW